jgi:hypothetical protein
MSVATEHAQSAPKLPSRIEAREDNPPQRRTRSFVQRISPSNLLLLKAALLDGDAAIAAYRAWRPTLDLDTIPYGQRRLLPLLQRNLTRFGIEDPLADKLRGIRRYFWSRNLKTMAFAQRIFAALDEAAVPFIVLKGAALIACYLVDRSLRPMDDIDILVPEERLADTTAVLTAMNLRPQGTTLSHLMLSSLRSRFPGWAFVGPDQNIDVHWKALHLDRRPEADDQFWQAHRKASFDGMQIRVLDPADQLLHICAHAAQQLSAAAAEQWPADAILVLRASKDLCVERLVSEAAQRGLSAIVAEGLDFLGQEFEISIPKTAISRMRATASLTERAEMRLLVNPGLLANNPDKATRIMRALLDFRRRSPGDISRSMVPVVPAFLKSWAGVNHITPALTVGAQVILGHPSWLRQFLGRDRHRILPDLERLPRVGDTLLLGGPETAESALICGWESPEATGRWTFVQEATIAWCVRGQDEDLTLLIDGDSTLYERGSIQKIDLFANDRRLESWRFQTSKVLPAQVRVPRDLIRNREVLMLTFLVRRPVAGGLYLRSLTLKAAQPHNIS